MSPTMSPQLGSMDGVNQYPYGDSGVEMDSRMGAVGPSANSGMPQNYGAWYWALMVSSLTTHSSSPQVAAQEPMEGMYASVKMQ